MAYTSAASEGSVTIWQPLTTVYTPPASCSSIYYLSQGSALAAFDPYYGLNINSAVTCMPPQETSLRVNQGMYQGNVVVPSIGPMTCPYQWTTASEAVVDQTSTMGVCCPTGYEAHDEWYCTSSVNPGPVIAFMNSSTAKGGSTTWTAATTTLTKSTVLWAAAVQGWNIETMMSMDMMSMTYVTTATASAIPDASSSASHSELSSGAAAGIGIGVALAVVGSACLAAALFIAKRRRQRRQQQQQQDNRLTAPPGYDSGGAQYHGGSTTFGTQMEQGGYPAWSEQQQAKDPLFHQQQQQQQQQIYASSGSDGVATQAAPAELRGSTIPWHVDGLAELNGAQEARN